MKSLKKRRAKHRQIDKDVRIKHLLHVIEVWKRRHSDLQRSSGRV